MKADILGVDRVAATPFDRGEAPRKPVLTPIQLVGGALILGAAVLLQLRPGIRADHEAVAQALPVSG